MIKYKSLTHLRMIAKKEGLKGADRKTLKEIEKYFQGFGKKVIEASEIEEVESIEPLRFINSGWCESLGKSYRKGLYLPKTQEECNELKKYTEEK